MTNNFKHQKLVSQVEEMSGDEHFFHQAEDSSFILYNSLKRKKETFRPIDDRVVRMYSCGPTVYNNPHIGNLATFIRDDLLKRTLKAAGYKVKHVMNITDVDDKTIRDSKLTEFLVEDDPMGSLKNLTKKYGKVFRDDIAKVGNDVSSIDFIAATDTIKDMLSLIQKILDSGVGYIAEDGVYFSISKYVGSGKEYGVLQKLNLAKASSRIDNDEYEKESVADFALWKKAQDGEPSWGAMFKNSDGQEIEMAGRPGWHIECSAMSEKLLGVPFDIHTGGIDLKFPHHENEIAQSCAATGKDMFANYFVHMSHILVDGRKMAKSANNFYTLRDIEEKGFDPQAFRLLVLSGHYRSEINFSWEILEAAQNRLRNWQAVADLMWQGDGAPDDNSSSILENFIYNAENYLFDDLYTPKVVALIDAALSDATNVSLSLGFNYKQGLSTILMYIEGYLGIRLKWGDISNEQKELLDLRQKARDEKDFEESDRLRDELKLSGLDVRDTDNGQIWSRV